MAPRISPQDLENRIRMLIPQCAAAPPEDKQRIADQIAKISEEYRAITGRTFDVRKSFDYTTMEQKERYKK